jgi:hypothetical protein
MISFKHIPLVVLLLVALAGCSALTAPQAQNAANVPAPQSGKATVTGRVTSVKDGSPIVDIPVRLAEVYKQGDAGAFVLDGALSPGAMTTDTGSFVIENIDAREYVLVVGDVYGKHTIISDDSGKAQVWQADANKVLNVGDIVVDPGT